MQHATTSSIGQVPDDGQRSVYQLSRCPCLLSPMTCVHRHELAHSRTYPSVHCGRGCGLGQVHHECGMCACPHLTVERGEWCSSYTAHRGATSAVAIFLKGSSEKLPHQHVVLIMNHPAVCILAGADRRERARLQVRHGLGFRIQSVRQAPCALVAAMHCTLLAPRAAGSYQLAP